MFVGSNFRRSRILIGLYFRWSYSSSVSFFTGYNFRQLPNISSLLTEETLTVKVCHLFTVQYIALSQRKVVLSVIQILQDI